MHVLLKLTKDYQNSFKDWQQRQNTNFYKINSSNTIVYVSNLHWTKISTVYFSIAQTTAKSVCITKHSAINKCLLP